MGILESLSKNKIFSRVTASSAVIGGLYMLNTYFTNPAVNAEVLAVAAAIMGSAATFLFMSEKD